MRDLNYDRTHNEDSSPNQNDEINSNNSNNNNNQTSLSSWMLCLEEDLDKEIYVVLRHAEARVMVFLDSFDPYGSLCLERSFAILSNNDRENAIYQGRMIFRGHRKMLCGLPNQNIKSYKAS
ncbi:hypothetical protein, partial [Cryptosporidium hominis TU502]|uniref:hypothetical protein n=1 Tax=Cryptosporidium hominis (strain TU502) TaxID=353151 RepID=UPI00004528F3